jgi:hypothetical protein
MHVNLSSYKQIKQEKTNLPEITKCNAMYQMFASYLDLYFEMYNKGRFKTKLYNKHDDSTFYNI